MTKWQRSMFMRLLVYGVVAIFAFLMAASVGAIAALIVSGDLSWPARDKAESEKPSLAGKQGNTPQRQQAKAGQRETADAEREKATPQVKVIYVDRVGEIQAVSVETFLETHEKLLRYDALTADDVQEMQADQSALQGYANQAGNLDAPQKYKEQKDVFVSAINELHQAAQQAFSLAADPTSATQSGFEEYDGHVERAAVLLMRSNETLERDYETIENVQRVSPP